MAIELPWGNYALAGKPPEDAKRKRGQVAEPIWYLKALSYGVYRTSEHWRLRRRQFLADAAFMGRLYCARCDMSEIDQVEVQLIWYCDRFGRPCDGRGNNAFKNTAMAEVSRPPRFEVNHLSYKNLGREPDEDLELLCHPCHNLHHRPNSPAAKWWLEYLEHMDMLTPAHLNAHPTDVDPIIPGAEILADMLAEALAVKEDE